MVVNSPTHSIGDSPHPSNGKVLNTFPLVFLQSKNKKVLALIFSFFTL